MKPSKTGAYGRDWIEYSSPKPPPVWNGFRTMRWAIMQRFWMEEPPELSERCQWWITQIENGWLPPSRWMLDGYDACVHHFGIYYWEWFHVIYPLIKDYEGRALLPK